MVAGLALGCRSGARSPRSSHGRRARPRVLARRLRHRGRLGSHARRGRHDRRHRHGRRRLGARAARGGRRRHGCLGPGVRGRPDPGRLGRSPARHDGRLARRRTGHGRGRRRHRVRTGGIPALDLDRLRRRRRLRPGDRRRRPLGDRQRRRRHQHVADAQHPRLAGELGRCLPVRHGPRRGDRRGRRQPGQRHRPRWAHRRRCPAC